ncbi:TauD/TfdA family dioxygenase [Streptomyces cyaneus]|uniref:TauD/TfdA family dioxygenase n=1 Tax=Streptomyces cyaneus TaxID=1904 RepID=UPI000FF892C6
MAQVGRGRIARVDNLSLTPDSAAPNSESTTSPPWRSRRRRVHQPYADVFVRNRIDLTVPGAEERIAGRRETGFVTVDGLASRTAVLTFATRIMHLVPHRDSDPDGLTTICDTRRDAHRAGLAGFGNGPLDPHTERSGTPNPPRPVLLVCGQTGATDEECLLTGGQAVHYDLSTGDRQAGAALAQPRTAFFGAGDGHTTQVFTAHDGLRVSVRLRFDGLARWNPIVQPYLPQLRATAGRHQVRLDLAPGQGYLLDNERRLHARRAFTGDRLFCRALGKPLFPMLRGFARPTPPPPPVHPCHRRRDDDGPSPKARRRIDSIPHVCRRCRCSLGPAGEG